jgi:probable phosphoglycerate mutase
MIPDPFIHIRHGETDWNLARRLQGWRDIPLNDTGRAQALANGARLKGLFETLGRSPDDFSWVASPLQRARETMEIIRRAVGLEPSNYRVDDRLREISYGVLEGKTHEEIEAEAPDLYYRLRHEKWAFQPSEGESYAQLAARVEAALSEMTDPGIVVAHGGVFRALKSLLDGGPKNGIVDFVVPQDRFFLVRDGVEQWV